MFIGHFGIGLAAKKIAPNTSLGTLFIAAQFLDFLWPNLLLLHVEKATINQSPESSVPLEFTHYPLSHSLTMAFLWSFLFGLLYWIIKKDTKAAIILAIGVLSHWILDFVVHLPDLPLYPGNSPEVGLGLWTFPMISTTLEGIIFCIGIFLYLQSKEGGKNRNTLGFWSLITVLVILHVLSLIGPPPTSIIAVAWGTQLLWIFVAWAFWIDRKRTLAIEYI